MKATSVKSPLAGKSQACGKRACRISRGFLFSLIELLLVIGIIALLMAIILPSLASAREAAKKTACQGNIRQVWLGLMNYAEFYSGEVPTPDGRPDNNDLYGFPWIRQLVRMECLPGNANSLSSVPRVAGCPGKPVPNFYSTYGLKAAYGNKRPLNIYRNNDPSHCLYFGDSSDGADDTQQWYGICEGYADTWKACLRHVGGNMNAAFGDGSVRPLKNNDLSGYGISHYVPNGGGTVLVAP